MAKLKRNPLMSHEEVHELAKNVKIGDVWVHKKEKREVVVLGLESPYRLKLLNPDTGRQSVSQLIFFSRDFIPKKHR